MADGVSIGLMVVALILAIVFLVIYFLVPFNQGSVGNKGPTGPIGQAGPDGTAIDVVGPKGPAADTTITDPSGNTGPTGPTGIAGNIGLMGDDGVKGGTGITGPNGPPNIAATYIFSDRGVAGNFGAIDLSGQSITPLSNLRSQYIYILPIDSNAYFITLQPEGDPTKIEDFPVGSNFIISLANVRRFRRVALCSPCLDTTGNACQPSSTCTPYYLFANVNEKGNPEKMTNFDLLGGNNYKFTVASASVKQPSGNVQRVLTMAISSASNICPVNFGCQ